MSPLNRRQLLQNLLGGLVQTTGAVLLARAVLTPSESQAAPSGTLEERADQVAAEQGPLPEGEGEQFTAFVNGGFVNGGGFRKGGFANGGFRNGGGFKKGGFVNGGFNNGGFRKGGFVNGGFRN